MTAAVPSQAGARGKSKTKKVDQDTQTTGASGEPDTIEEAELQATVTITLPTEIEDAGEALDQALLTYWKNEEVLEILTEALAFVDNKWRAESQAPTEM